MINFKDQIKLFTINNEKKIADAIEKNELPKTEGFFFGSSEDHEQEKKENIKIFRDASAWLDKKLVEGYQGGDWFSIYYEASW